MNEKYERANALLESFDYFFCDMLNARMSKKSCLLRQRDKNCSHSNNCNQGVVVYNENIELRQEVYNDPNQPQGGEKNFKNNYRGFKNEPKSSGKGEEMNTKGPKKATRDKMCIFGTCTNDITARGLCKTHYNTWRTKGLQGIDPYVKRLGVEDVLEKKVAKIKAERKEKPKMPEPKKEQQQDDTGNTSSTSNTSNTKDPSILYLDLSQYKGLMDGLRKEAHTSVRTPEQQAIFYIKHCVGIDQNMEDIKDK